MQNLTYQKLLKRVKKLQSKMSLFHNQLQKKTRKKITSIKIKKYKRIKLSTNPIIIKYLKNKIKENPYLSS